MSAGHEIHVWQERSRWSWKCLNCDEHSEHRAYSRRSHADIEAEAHDAAVRRAATCDHRTRPAALSDQRPLCIRCWTFVDA